MINWSSKHIALIAVFFFTAFVGVFTTNALCDLEIIEYAPNLAHNHAEEVAGDHHNDKKSTTHSHNSNDSSSTEDDPCCDDITSQLESSLFSKIIKKQVSVAKYFLLGSVSVLNNLVSLYQSTNIIYHEYDTPPPLGGSTIRVLIQSFLN